MQIGDRVYLRNDKGLVAGEQWPVIGTKYECYGTIVDKDAFGKYRIEWDNGATIGHLSSKFLKYVGKDTFRNHKKKLNL